MPYTYMPNTSCYKLLSIVSLMSWQHWGQCHWIQNQRFTSFLLSAVTQLKRFFFFFFPLIMLLIHTDFVNYSDTIPCTGFMFPLHVYIALQCSSILWVYLFSFCRASWSCFFIHLTSISHWSFSFPFRRVLKNFSHGVVVKEELLQVSLEFSLSTQSTPLALSASWSCCTIATFFAIIFIFFSILFIHLFIFVL